MEESRSTILIVDDEPSGRDTLESILESEGYILEMAENGFQAIEKAKKLLPEPGKPVTTIIIPNAFHQI